MTTPSNHTSIDAAGDALGLVSRSATNDGVKIHYMAGGSGPLVVFVHGFPDFWYSWHHQIESVISTHAVAAMDTRGFHRSDAPEGVDAYSLDLLAGDVAAVIAAEGRSSAIVVGHDWGGATAWALAQRHPELVDRLVVVNTPHPQALAAQASRAETGQLAAFAYVNNFRAPGSESDLSAEFLATSVARDDLGRALYAEAFEQSSFEAMMNYYRQPATAATGGRVGVPVLQIHGLDDPVLLAVSLNSTWEYLDNTWTLITIPGAGHWAHHDQPDLVSGALVDWLARGAPTRASSTTLVADGCCGSGAADRVSPAAATDVQGDVQGEGEAAGVCCG